MLIKGRPAEGGLYLFEPDLIKLRSFCDYFIGGKATFYFKIKLLPVKSKPEFGRDVDFFFWDSFFLR